MAEKDYSDFKVDPLPAEEPASRPKKKVISAPTDLSDFKVDPAVEPTEEDWGTLALSALGEGAAEAAGFAADIVPSVGGAIGKAGRWALGKKQLTPEEEANLPDPLGIRKVADTAQKYAGSEALKGYEKKIGGFDEFYQPKTTAGKYAYEGVRLLPSAVAGPATLGRAALKEGVKVASKEVAKNATRFAAVPAVTGVSAEQIAEQVPFLKLYAPYIKTGVEALTSIGSGFHGKAPDRAVAKPDIRFAPEPSPSATVNLRDRRAMVERARAGTPAAGAHSAKADILASAVERAKNSTHWRKNRGEAVAAAFRGIADDPAQMARFTAAEQKQIRRIVRGSTTLSVMQNLGRFSHSLGPALGAVLEGGLHVLTHAIPGMGVGTWLGMEGARVAGRVIPKRHLRLLSDMVRTGKGPMKSFPSMLPGIGQATSDVMYSDKDRP